ncbi:MAG TPA: hypothetical protein PKA41_01050 [Verrucomicrobiota bacterium]|nr:hypothetical protein [Verrucomicrobiota bacterium]
MKAKPHSSQTAGQPSTGIGLDDVYFTLFRHKVIILVCICLGVIGVIIARSVTKPVYSSQTKLVVRYIVDRKELAPVDEPGTAVINPGSESVLIAETEILTSMDLAHDVAQAIGPEKILAFKEGGNNVMDAAGMVRAGISVHAPRRSDVMYIYFYHPDSAVVQPVLEEIIKAYLLKHREVRMATEFDEQHYSEQLVQIRKQLAQTEEEIKKVLSESKVVISIDDAKIAYAKQIQKLTEELLDSKSQLYTLNATLADSVLTNDTSVADAMIPAEKLEYYANVLAGLNELRKRERELVVQGYKEAHPQVQAIRQSMDELKKAKTELETEHPGLILNEHTAAGTDLGAEQAKIRALAAKIKGHENLLAGLKAEVLGLLDVEPRIKELERERIQELRNFDHVAANLDKARSAMLGGNRVTGINVVEKPTPPFPTNRKLQKLMKMILGGFVALGFGIAILFDYVLDRTIKRSADVRRNIRLPLFLTIPHTGWNGGGFKLLPSVSLHNLLPGRSTNGKPSASAVAHRLPAWDSNHHLRLYTEGLRERLITNFEVNAVTHKPKLIGVTSCGPGAGTSTLSTGLAAALSKTGDGNVLLVDMNSTTGETTTFYKGKPNLRQETILTSASGSGIRLPDSGAPSQASNTLDPGDESADNSESLMVPSQFNKFMPELKASDYDYVVFDMPPVTPTSATPRLAGSMDKVLLVLEAEKTPQQTAHDASVLLEEARANAAVVLNKCKRHVPKMLSPEL